MHTTLTSQQDEEKPEFIDVIAPQKTKDSYYLRISVKSRLKAFFDTMFLHPTKPLVVYEEEFCEFHEGYHCTLRSPNDAPMRCYEGELLRRGEIKKPEKGRRSYDF